MKKYLMKCGHAANAENDGKPCCAICAGVTPAAFEVQAEIDGDGDELLLGRKAVCPLCGHKTESSFKLPFFEFRPNQDEDSYYCGCRGWE